MFIEMENEIIKITAFDEITKYATKYSTGINFYKLGTDGKMVLAISVEFETKEKCEEQWKKIADALNL